MFIIKATYRGETRKLSFPEHNTFPPFDQICNHLCRIFPVSHHYFLSKLLFCMNASQSSRILIGQEVHTTDDYNNCIQPYQYRNWPNGLLRITVVDGNVEQKGPLSLSSARLDNGHTSNSTLSTWTYSSNQPDASYTPSMSTIQSIYAVPSTTSPTTRNVRFDTHHSLTGTSSTDAFCPVTSVKVEIESLVSKFQKDVDHALNKALNKKSHLPSTPTSYDFKCESTPEVATFTSTGQTVPSVCSSCASRQSDTWYSCSTCHIISCFMCKPYLDINGICFPSAGTHTMKIGLPSNEIPPNSTSAFPNWNSSVPSTQTPGCPIWSPAGVTGFPTVNKLAASPVEQTRKEPPTPVFVPFIPPAVSPEPSPNRTPVQTSRAQLYGSSGPETPSRSAVVHHGVICDSCDTTIRGIRHKCLECADYDLCSACISSGAAERHQPFHEFFDIAEPGHVIVHTVFEGDQRTGASSSNAQPDASAPVNHPATCNLCDSRIRGDRYKCVACPDFDTCSACYSIIDEQHPNHAFVKITDPSCFISRGRTSPPVHLASCDACKSIIRGIRYKCMHSDCPDFDLCAGCEAHPIRVHPTNHPLLKMRDPDTVIPTVYRVGGTQLIQQPVVSETVVPVPDVSPPLDVHETPLASGRDSPAPIPPSPFSFSDVDHNEEDSAPSPGLPSVSIMEGFYSSPGDDGRSKSPPILPEINLIGSYDNGSVESAAADPLLEWRRSSTELGHLMEGHANVDAAVVSEKGVASDAAPEEDGAKSPLTEQEELLQRSVLTAPEMQERRSSGIPSVINGYSLASVLHGDQAAADEPFFTPKSISEDRQLFDEPEFSAAFVSDVTVADGQAFPPGAEFVKCWRMANNGNEDWGEGTELVFVGGSGLGSDMVPVKVGTVKAGTETDISTGELKAPETPGKYVGYWRLRDGNGRFFGDSIWVEIEVADLSEYSDHTDESMASSTVIMPNGAQTSGQLTTTDEGVSEDGSSISLLSSALSDEEDEQLWEDSRRIIAQDEQGSEYVLLYDDRSSSEEE